MSQTNQKRRMVCWAITTDLTRYRRL